MKSGDDSGSGSCISNNIKDNEIMVLCELDIH